MSGLSLEEAVEKLHTDAPTGDDVTDTSNEQLESEDTLEESDDIDGEYEVTDEDDSATEEDHLEDDSEGYEDDETDADDSDEGTGDDELSHTVLVDGKEQNVSLNDLKRGYSGQEYVQKGMRENADARKATEQVFTSLQQQRQLVGQYLQAIESGQMVMPPPAPAEELLQTDPLRYFTEKEQYDAAHGQFQGLVAQLRQTVAQGGQADQQALQYHAQEQGRMLVQAEPDFADPAKAATMRASMDKSAIEHYGYTAEELQGVTDHRALRVLLDAARWRDAQTTAKDAPKRVKKKIAKKGVRRKKPASADAVKRQKQQARFRSTGNIRDAVDLI